MKTNHRVSGMKLVSLNSVLVFGLFALSTAAEGSKQLELVDKASITLNTFMEDPNMGWFRRNVKDSPGMHKFHRQPQRIS